MALMVDNNGNPIGNTAVIEAKTAEEIDYDNTESGLTATDVQAAIDEVNDNLLDKIVTITASVTTDQYGWFTAKDTLKPYTDNGYKVIVAHVLNSNSYAFINLISGYVYAFNGQSSPQYVRNQTVNIIFILVKIQ